MYFSCKVTNSVIKYFDEKGDDISPLFEELSLPLEFLRDPSSWVSSLQLEMFFQKLLAHFNSDQTLLAEIAHQSAALKSWGVLDSVLRMMPRTDEVWAQPEKFLSYFVSPPPPVANLERGADGISFDVPITSEQYPLSTFFLQSCFESLPKFNGQPAAHARWDNIRLSIQYADRQDSLFGTVDPGFRVSPDLMRQVVSNLEVHQRDLEEKNAELQRKNEKLNSELSIKRQQEFQDLQDSDVFHLRHQLGRLTDYMVRAQQLVSLLGAQDKNQKFFKDIMRKLDWDFVKSEFPKTVEDTYKILERTERGSEKISEKKNDSGETQHTITH